MPTYAYVCDQCGARQDVQHGMREEPDVCCTSGHAMRKDVAAAFPHVALCWHNGQGIGERLVIQSARRKEADGHPAVASHARA